MSSRLSRLLQANSLDSDDQTHDDQTKYLSPNPETSPDLIDYKHSFELHYLKSKSECQRSVCIVCNNVNLDLIMPLRLLYWADSYCREWHEYASSALEFSACEN